MERLDPSNDAIDVDVTPFQRGGGALGALFRKQDWTGAF